MHPQNFMIFGTYKLHNAENAMMLSLCHYVNSYSPEGATNMSTFYLHYSSLLSLNFFTLKECILFLHSLLKFYSKQKFVWFVLFGSIYQHFTFLQIATCFTWFC